jgi:hypothetical protein
LSTPSKADIHHKFPIAADHVTPDDPKQGAPHQEQPDRHYRDDAALPYYDRHPEHRPRPWRRGQLRRRARLIRENRKFAYRAPEPFAELLNILVDASASYLIRQFEAGVDAVQIFDSWAGILPDGEFDRCCVEPCALL